MTPPTTDLDARVRAKRADRFGNSPTGKPPQPTSTTSKPKGDRWRTLNQFSDSIEPHLSLAERAVWQKMFRRARDGQCQTTARKLAAAMRINKATVSRALATLTRAGLVWVIWHARDKGRDSCYGIHPTPADCLSKLLLRTRRTPK
jgi:predicted transcriptional regulator